MKEDKASYVGAIMMTNKKNQSGRSMVEMLGVLAIIGLISIGGITSMGYVDSYFRVNSTILEVDNIAADVADTYSWDSNYSGIDLQEMCQEKALDDCTLTGTTYSLENRWGGAITIDSADDGASFTITYEKVPLVSCQQLYDASLTRKTFHYVDLTAPTSDTDCSEESTLVFKYRG